MLTYFCKGWESLSFGGRLLAAERGLAVRTTVKVWLVFGGGKVCALGALNLLPKIPSVRSRLFGEAADTVTDPLPVARAAVARCEGASGDPDRVYIGPRKGPTALAQYTVRTAGADLPSLPAISNHA
jgi:hypothetical protein